MENKKRTRSRSSSSKRKEQAVNSLIDTEVQLTNNVEYIEYGMQKLTNLSKENLQMGQSDNEDDENEITIKPQEEKTHQQINSIIDINWDQLSESRPNTPTKKSTTTGSVHSPIHLPNQALDIQQMFTQIMSKMELGNQGTQKMLNEVRNELKGELNQINTRLNTFEDKLNNCRTRVDNIDSEVRLQAIVVNEKQKKTDETLMFLRSDIINQINIIKTDNDMIATNTITEIGKMKSDIASQEANNRYCQNITKKEIDRPEKEIKDLENHINNWQLDDNDSKHSIEIRSQSMHEEGHDRNLGEIYSPTWQNQNTIHNVRLSPYLEKEKDELSQIPIMPKLTRNNTMLTRQNIDTRILGREVKPYFDGNNTTAPQFIREVEAFYFATNCHDDYTRIKMFRNFLGDNPLDWWQLTEDDIMSWEYLKQRFLKQYFGDHIIKELEKEWSDLYYSRKTDMETYILKAWKLQKAMFPDRNEKICKEMIGKVPKSLRNYLAVKSHRNLDEFLLNVKEAMQIKEFRPAKRPGEQYKYNYWQNKRKRFNNNYRSNDNFNYRDNMDRNREYNYRDNMDRNREYNYRDNMDRNRGYNYKDNSDRNREHSYTDEDKGYKENNDREENYEDKYKNRNKDNWRKGNRDNTGKPYFNPKRARYRNKDNKWNEKDTKKISNVMNRTNTDVETNELPHSTHQQNSEMSPNMED